MNNIDLLVLGIGVSKHKTDGVIRFEKFCAHYNLEYKIVGEGKVWTGGSMVDNTGGGQKINELLEAIENMDNKLLVVCDTFDLFPIGSKDEIIEKYQQICGRNEILFSSEVFCWPDKTLADSYPEAFKISRDSENNLEKNKYRYLNSGGFIGFRDDIYASIKNANINNSDDDQLYFTQQFLEGKNIVLDYNCEMFQTLCGVPDDVVVYKNRIFNKYTNSYPVFIHGNGPAKKMLNHLENYIDPNPKLDFTRDLLKCVNSKVFFALYVDSSNPEILHSFLKNVTQIEYENKIIYVYDRNYSDDINLIAEHVGFIYRPNITAYTFDDFKQSDAEFYFLLEQRCIITNTQILKSLLPLCNQYHRIICPLLKANNNSFYSNFWGELDGNGFYKRSDNYIELINYGLRGLWNCPYVTGSILFDRSIILEWDITAPNRYDGNNIDMQLCLNLRKNTLFMYMCNLEEYGYLH